MPNITEMTKDLEEHLKNGNDWSTFDIPIPNAGVVRTADTNKKGDKTLPKLALVINPNQKRKGRYLWTIAEFVNLLEDLTTNQEAYLKILKVISKINGNGNGKKIIIKAGTKWDSI